MEGKTNWYFIATTIAAYLISTATAYDAPYFSPQYNQDLIHQIRKDKPHPDPCIKIKSNCPVPEKENATLLPNPEDCASYCACMLGTSIWMPCPEGLHFNPSLNVCDTPSDAGCASTTNPSTDVPTNNTSYAHSTEGTNDPTTTTTTETTSSNNSNGCYKVKAQCPVPEKENATLLPNPDDCESYCVCLLGTAVWMPCPEGLHFNPSLNVCDTPSDAGCGSVPKPTSDVPTNNTNNPPPTEITTLKTTTTHHDENGCQKVKSQCPVPEKENATLLPNPDDCESYCVCLLGTAIWMPCPEGLHFNPSLNVCDTPTDAGCGSVPKPTSDVPTNNTNNPPPTEITTLKTTTTHHNENGCQKVKSQCPVPEKENATLLPNPDDCESYCVCLLGTAIWMPCPEGLHFNPSLNVCDTPSDAGCGSVPNPTSGVPTNNTNNPPPTEITTLKTTTTHHNENGCQKVKSQCPVPEKKNATLLPNPDDCESYCVCLLGTAIWMPCPEGLHFNPSLNVCDTPTDAGCGSVPKPTSDVPTNNTNNPPPTEITTLKTTTTHHNENGCQKVKSQCPVPEKENATLLPNPDDCESYCVCLLGTAIWMPCPEGLHFNPSLNVCDTPTDAGCGSVPKPTSDVPTNNTNNPPPTEITTLKTTTTHHNENGCQKVKSQCPVPEKENATLLPNPDDCESYCVCLLGTAIWMPCPEGLHFNPSLNVCDTPSDAGCGSVPNPTSGVPTNNTNNPPPTEITTHKTTTTHHDENGCQKVKSQCPVPEKENATLLPNPDDCESYCVCLLGTAIWMPCPEGLHFNPSLNVCDTPSDAGCGSVPNPTSGVPTNNTNNPPPTEITTLKTTTTHHDENGCQKVKSQCPVPEKENATLLPNPDDCESYCVCLLGTAIWMPCPEGLHFNPSLNVCDTPNDAGCGSVPKPTSDVPTNNTTNPLPTEITTLKTTTTHHDENGCQKVKSQCPVPEKENATLLPNPDDCESYCVCLLGTAVWMPCPEGLHFNPSLNVCDTPSDAGCGSAPNPTTDKSTNNPTYPHSTESHTTPETITTTGSTSSNSSNGCYKVSSQCPVPEKENAILLPNPDDCESYCVCLLGTALWMPCPEGLHFNPSLDVCDTPSDAGCDSVPKPTSDVPTNNTTNPLPTDMTTLKTTTAHHDENGCNKVKYQCPVPEKENATLLQNPDDCESYCVCILGTAVWMPCPEGLYFNPSLKVCDSPSDAGCETAAKSTTELPSNSTTYSSTEKTSAPTNSTTERTTENQGSNGCNKVVSQCPVPEKENATLLPNPDDCESFCVCLFGTAVWMPCPEGLHFNPTLHVCDRPSDAGCDSGSTATTEIPNTNPTNTPTSDNTGGPITTTTASHDSNGCAKIKSNCPVPEKENATLLANPDGCGSYCACVWGVPVWMPCPEGLHFNPSLHVCDFPDDAGCDSTPTAPTGEATTPSYATPTTSKTACAVTSTPATTGVTTPPASPPPGKDGCYLLAEKCPHPEHIDHATLFSNPWDSRSYCKCDWGKIHWMPCAPGTVFVEKLQNCI